MATVPYYYGFVCQYSLLSSLNTTIMPLYILWCLSSLVCHLFSQKKKTKKKNSKKIYISKKYIFIALLRFIQQHHQRKESVDFTNKTIDFFLSRTPPQEAAKAGCGGSFVSKSTPPPRGRPKGWEQRRAHRKNHHAALVFLCDFICIFCPFLIPHL